jgi:hypothetical protein
VAMANNKFNGQCVIEFTYRRKKGVWRLVRNKVDPRVVEKLGKDFFTGLAQQLRKLDNEWRPYKHEGILLETLGKLRLDESVLKILSGKYRRKGQSYHVQIVVGQRRDEKAHGLAVS